MSTPFRLLLPAQLYREMLAQARAELPNECCGILAGRVETGVGRVEKRYSLINEKASPSEYVSDPESMLAAFKDWRRHELEVLAVYHSHPTSPPVPSRRDLERSYGPEVVNLIISLEATEPLVRGWWLTAEDYREAEWEVVEVRDPRNPR
jgi:[CysO sulfur-carrier protein]-S-L-cysteine hydrolase